MLDNIEILGIETNNLKNIDVSLIKHAINLIVGPSGSGKSSLAYDTIAQIGQHEFLSMFADEVVEPSYRVREYRRMVAAVPIRQTNHNNNLRSTIGTYFGVNRNIALIYAVLLGENENLFVLNKESNLCEHCHGLGFKRELDINRIVDYNVPLNQNPIKCWRTYKDFYSQILAQFSEDNGIDPNKNFRSLTENEKNIILSGESKNRYSIRFKRSRSFSRRTTKYYGIMTSTPMMPKFSPAKQFYTDVECSYCNGKKYSSEHDKYKLFGLSIGEFMTTPFEKLCSHISNILSKADDKRLTYALTSMELFLQKAIELNLGYLFFNRAIPTLSGGELQRLRLVQVFNTQLSDLLIVLDEPLAGLSGAEKISIYNNVLKLAQNHTLVIVEHSDIFVKDSQNVIALGEKSGKDGGKIIDAQAYLKKQRKEQTVELQLPHKFIDVSLKSKVYMYLGVKVKIAYECMNLVTGNSGVGKSTLLREYFPQQFEQYTYINQKPLLGNKNSSVATTLDVLVKIADAFSKKFSKDKQFFSNLTGCDGACPTCGGGGFLVFGSEASSSTRLACKECDGTGFNKNLKKYLLAGKNIFDIWDMTVDEAKEYFSGIDKKIMSSLFAAAEIMLGHLKVGQPTATLSGGENIRIKILKSRTSSAKVIGVDEPFKGLSNTEICQVMRFFEKLTQDKKTIVIVDHNEASFKYFPVHIDLINDGGYLIGKSM